MLPLPALLPFSDAETVAQQSQQSQQPQQQQQPRESPSVSKTLARPSDPPENYKILNEQLKLLLEESQATITSHQTEIQVLKHTISSYNAQSVLEDTSKVQVFLKTISGLQLELKEARDWNDRVSGVLCQECKRECARIGDVPILLRPLGYTPVFPTDSSTISLDEQDSPTNTERMGETCIPDDADSISQESVDLIDDSLQSVDRDLAALSVDRVYQTGSKEFKVYTHNQRQRSASVESRDTLGAVEESPMWKQFSPFRNPSDQQSSLQIEKNETNEVTPALDGQAALEELKTQRDVLEQELIARYTEFRGMQAYYKQELAKRDQLLMGGAQSN